MKFLKELTDKIDNFDKERFKDRLERFKQRVPRKPPGFQDTFCPYLFNDVFINDTGDVYPCCHMLPHKAGNIHENTLEEIWNSKRMKAARLMSLKRSLHCFDRCTLLDAESKSMRATDDDAVTLPYSRLTRVKILFGELCNLACIMCSQNHQSKVQLDVDMLKRQIDFTHIEDIEFQGGEPLAMKNCKAAYIWLTEEMGKKVNFLTNGTLITPPWAERICNGSNWLYFSINGVEPETFETVNAPAKFKRVLAGVERMIETRDKLGSDIELVGHFTMVPENAAEVDRFPALGIDRVEFGFDIGTMPKWVKENAEEATRIQHRFDEILADPPLPMKDHRLRMLGLINEGSPAA